LGWLFAKSIVEAHGGSITLSAVAGRERPLPFRLPGTNIPFVSVSFPRGNGDLFVTCRRDARWAFERRRGAEVAAIAAGGVSVAQEQTPYSPLSKARSHIMIF